MRIKTKIKSIVLLFVAFCVSLLLGIALISSTQTAKAIADTNTTSSFEIKGASLRYVNGNYDAAVRFHVTMTKETYQATIGNGASESGVLVVPNSKLGGAALTLENADSVYARKGIFSNANSNIWELNDDGLYEAKAVLSGIPQTNYGTTLAVVAYYTVNGKTTYCETYNTGSLSAVALAESKANPDDAEIKKLIDTYATFTVTVNGTETSVVYGDKVPFADVLNLTNTAGTSVWDSERKVTSNIKLVATAKASAATLSAQEIDLDINNDGSLNESNLIEFDLSSLNVGALTYGSDYTLTGVTVGGAACDLSNATITAEGNVLKVPASVFGYTYGEKEIGFTFNYCGVEVKVNADALLISKKISNNDELTGMNAIMTQYLDSTANTYGGYFMLDSDIQVHDPAKWATPSTRSGGVWTPAFMGLDTNGFVGTFDGCGYTIDGWIGNNSLSAVNGFITEIGVGGIVKNVAFTNAIITADSSVISAENNGTIENVYVHFYVIGVWVNSSGYFTEYNSGWAWPSMAAFNGGSWNATGVVKNAFVDFTDSAKVNYTDASTNENYGLSWHAKASSVIPLGKIGKTGLYKNGVYAVGIPAECTNPVRNETADDLFNWYVDEAAFETAYNAESSAIKAEISTWPIWLQELIPVPVPSTTLSKTQKIDLDINVKDGVVSLNEAATATIDLSEVGNVDRLLKISIDGTAVEDATLSSSKITFPVAQFGYAYGAKSATIYTETNKYIVPVTLVSKVIETKQELDDFGYIAKACESNTKTWGGYFELGSDIAYNDAYTGFIDPRGGTTGNKTGDRLGWAYAPGFIGTFDGCGHTIDGLKVMNLYDGFITVLGSGGVIRNVAFTNATVKMGGLITLGGKAGLIENVYVQMAAFGIYNSDVVAGSDGCGVFFAQPNGGDSGITLRNCFVDATTAKIAADNESTNYTSVGAIASMGNKDNTGSNYTGTLTNVYAVTRTDGYPQAIRDCMTSATLTAAFVNGANASYVGADAFTNAYAVDTTDNGVKATFDYLNELFGGVSLNASIPVEMTIAQQEIHLGATVVDSVVTIKDSVTVDISEVGDNLSSTTSLMYGETAIDGASVNGATLTIPTNTIFTIANYGVGENLTLVATTAEGKMYTITIPTNFVTSVIETKADLDNFATIAKAVVADDATTWGGNFQLGANIVYNDNLVERTGSGDLSKIPSKWNSGFAGTDTNGFVGTFDGKGYAIDGLLVYDGGFIPKLGASGVMKNIAFTNALVGKTGSVIAGFNEGLVQDIYVHVYAYGIYWGHGGTADAPTWCSYTYYNPGTFGANTAIINGQAWDAKGTVENVFVDFTESAKKMTVESGKDWTGKSWHDHANMATIRPFGLSSNKAAYNGIYAVGVPETVVNLGHNHVKGDLFNSYVDFAAFEEAIAENDAIANEIATWDLSFWKVIDGVPTYKYADTNKVMGRLDADLATNSDHTTVSTTARGEIRLSDVDTDFGTLESVAYNSTDLNGAFEDGVLSFDMAGFGTDFGEQTITVKFVGGRAFTVKVFVVTNIITTAAEVQDFGFVAALVGNAKHGRSDAKISDGYFELGCNIDFNGTYVAWQRRGSTPLWWDTGAAQGFAGVFDGCGYAIDRMTTGMGYLNGEIKTYGAFIPVLHVDGIIRNVAFTNAGINNSGSAGGFLAAAGQGVIENVYVKLTSASFGYGASIVATDNVRGASGPIVRNVFVDTTALNVASVNFYAVGGNGGDHYNNSTNASGADELKDTFVIYDGVYAMVNSAAQQERAFGAGGAYAGSANYAAYVGKDAFCEAYWTDSAMRTTMDALNEQFNLGFVFEDYRPTAVELTKTQNIDLNVDSSLNKSNEATIDLSEVGSDFGTLQSATLTSSASTYAMRSTSRELTGSIDGSTLTLDTSGFDVTEYGDYTLQILTSNRYNIVIPVSVVTNVIETKEELDSFDDIALAVGGGNGVYDGYFKLGSDIEYNATIVAGSSGNVWQPWFTVTQANTGDYDLFSSVTGFKGIFDGDGHSIHGWFAYNSAWVISGFITKIAEEGIVRNVAFTDVVNGGMSSVITAENNGLIENVYVHYYTFGAWMNASGNFSNYNEGWTSEYTATFNGGSDTATGTIRNVIVDMSDSAKIHDREESTVSYGKSWHYEGTGVAPLGRAADATYENVYAIGIPEDCPYAIGGLAAPKVGMGWYDKATEMAAVAGVSASDWATKFWRFIDGVPEYKYASNIAENKIDLDLALSADKTSATPAKASASIKLTDIDTDFGEFVSATFNSVDLGGEYSNGTLTLTNLAGFGYAYGSQTINVAFSEGTMAVSVLLVTDVIESKDELATFGYLSKLCEDGGKDWGGYFELGADIDYGKTKFQPFINPSTSAGTTEGWTGETLSWNYLAGGFKGVFDGCGHTISNMLICDSEWKCGAFITALAEGGVIRNVAFKNAYKGSNGGFLVTGGAGLIENVFVDIAWLGTTNGNTGNNGYTTDCGTIFGQTNNNSSLKLKLVNCFVDAEDLKVGTDAGTENEQKVGAFGRFVDNGGGGAYLGSMSGVYVINGHASAITMNTTVEDLLNENYSEYTSKSALMAAYTSNGDVFTEINAYPEWMQELILTEAYEDPLDNYFANLNSSKYLFVLGNANGKEAAAGVGDAWIFIKQQVEIATGATLRRTYRAADFDLANGRYIVIGDETLATQAGIAWNGTGYGVFSVGDDLFVMAEDSSGYQLAALKLLENVMGYRAYSAGGLGSSTSATLSDDSKFYDAEFKGFTEYLSVENGAVALSNVTDMADYTNTVAFQHRLSGAFGLMDTNGAYSVGVNKVKNMHGAWHNLTDDGELVPYSTYGTDHPEWYYDSGKQLCFTAGGNATSYTTLVETVGKAVIDIANSRPSVDIVPVTTEDNSVACTCTYCLAKGSATDAYVAFVNDVAEYVNTAGNGLARSTPIKIAFFAYNGYKAAPKNETLNENTYLVLAPIGLYYNERMDGSNNTADWTEIEKWLSLSKERGVQVYFWTYELNQYDWFVPRDSFKATLENYELLADYDNIDVMLTEHLWHNANVSGFGQLKAYMNSRKMADVRLTYEQLVNEFFGRNSDGSFTGKGYYGPAGQYMYLMYTEYQAFLATSTETGKPFTAETLSWDKATITKWFGYINSAYTAVAGSANEALYKEHILIESMMPRWIYANVLNTYSKAILSYYNITYSDGYASLINQTTGVAYTGVWEFRKQFLTDAAALGYIYYGSGAAPTMYSLDQIWTAIGDKTSYSKLTLSATTVYTLEPKTYY